MIFKLNFYVSPSIFIEIYEKTHKITGLYLIIVEFCPKENAQEIVNLFDYLSFMVSL
jgi:hypothetical protein